MDAPLSPVSRLYLVLGSRSSQKDRVVLQLAEYLLQENEHVVVCYEDGHGMEESEDLARCLGRGMKMETWTLQTADGVFDKAPPADSEPGVLLWLGPGNRRLVDAIEAVSNWLPESGRALERVITWVDAGLYQKSRHAQHWYQCCFHFSDLVILDEFKDLPASWLKEFKDFFHRECYPCIIENTRKGRVQHLNIALDNQALRISQVFEPEEDEYDGFEVVDEDKDSAGEDSEFPEENPTERYFERSLDGRHSNPVPDILEN
jgi:hypothetical protein